MTQQISPSRRKFLRTMPIGIGALQLGPTGSAAASFLGEGTVPSLGGAVAWLNSPALTKENLRGEVALFDFWTYTCINWRRTYPYLRAWHEKYEKHGLKVIGVHTPEFGFESHADNVARFAKELQIKYPVAIDSEYAIWRAFENEYWPALYLADAQGHIGYHKFGEGDFERTERAIQDLLRRAGGDGFDSQLAPVKATGAEAAADWAYLKSSENYVGYAHTEGFVSRGGFAFDKNHSYVAPERLQRNEWALAGNWTAQKQAIQLNAPNGSIVYQFHARDLHLVMGPERLERPVRFRILIDGQIPGASHGTDTDDRGNGVVIEPRMYQLTAVRL